MTNTGIVRKMDNLGRIVIAKEIRRVLDINEGDAVETYIEGDLIILKKYAPACIFCGEAREVENYKGKNICKSCRAELKK